MHDIITRASCFVSRDKVSRLLNKTAAAGSPTAALLHASDTLKETRSEERTSCSKCDIFLSKVPTRGRRTRRTGMSYGSLWACGSHGTATPRISFHSLQQKQNGSKSVGLWVTTIKIASLGHFDFEDGFLSFDGCDGETGSLTCLPLFPGRPVGPLFPAVPGSPFGPISPCTKLKKHHPNGQQGRSGRRSKALKGKQTIYCLTFCPSMPGKPIAPCGEGRADEMQRRYVHSMNCCATADRLSHLVAFCPALTAVASRTLESRWMSVTSCHKHRKTSLSAHLNMLFTDNNLKGHEPSRLCSQSSPGIKAQTRRNEGTFLFLCVDKCKGECGSYPWSNWSSASR